jgi:hypothetical protein
MSPVVISKTIEEIPAIRETFDAPQIKTKKPATRIIEMNAPPAMVARRPWPKSLHNVRLRLAVENTNFKQ